VTRTNLLCGREVSMRILFEDRLLMKGYLIDFAAETHLTFLFEKLLQGGAINATI
jgi:hypothetical protein